MGGGVIVCPTVHFDKLDIMNILLSYVVIIILIFIFRRDYRIGKQAGA
jgi:hypothetical protein